MNDEPPVDADIARGVQLLDDREPTADGGAALLPAAWAGLRQHRRWAGGAALLAIAVAALAYAAVPRGHTARADVWLDHGFGQVAGAPARAGSAADQATRNTEIRLLTSNDLATQVVDRLGLANVRGVGQPLDGALRPPTLARRIAVAAVRDNLAVRATGTSYAVSVRYRAADPVLATGVLNALLDSYVADRRIGGAQGREREIIRAQVASARDEAIRTQAAINGYRAATSLVRRTEDRRAIGAEVAGLEAELTRVKAEQGEAEARLRAATGGNGGGSPRLLELKRQRDELRPLRPTTGTPAAAAPATDARAATIRHEIELENRRVQRFVDAVGEARQRTGVIAAALARASDEQRAGREAAAQIDRLAQKADAARARFADLSSRFDRLIAAQRGRQGTAYVIAHAQPRLARRSPDPLLFALGGLLAALLAAGLVVLVLERLTKGFRDRRQFERLIGVPVIGMVPDLTRVRDADLPAEDLMAPADYLYNHQRSAFSAAFRAIHTGLRLGRGSHGARTIAVSSALQEEGKTTVSICLARSAALAGLRVILIDGDARRPAASRALSAYTPIGLAEVLEDRVHFRKALQTDTPSGAWFLAHGNDRSVANGAIRMEALHELIETVRREFDLVLIDTPPALALAESREMAALADAVLLVARARRTPVDATRIAYDQLCKAGAKVGAAVLTMVAP